MFSVQKRLHWLNGHTSGKKMLKETKDLNENDYVVQSNVIHQQQTKIVEDFCGQKLYIFK